VRTLKVASLLACCAFAVNLTAQDEGRRRPVAEQPPGATGQVQPGTTIQEGQQPGRRGAFARGGMMQIQDRDLAAMLAISNRGEVEMANFFKGRTQNEKIREFADMLIKDHSAFLEKLNAVAGQQPIAGERAAGNVGISAQTPQPQTQPPEGVAVRTPPGGGVNVQAPGVGVQVGGQGRSFYTPGMNPMLSLKEEIAQECLTNEKKELEQKQGVEADKCFVGTQIVKHGDMVSTLTVMQRRAQDSQFKEMVGQALQKTQHHLDMGKTIMKELDQQKAGQ
jgi:predicted outer membrane protein